MISAKTPLQYWALVSQRETEAVVATREQILQAVSHTDSGTAEDVLIEEPSQEDAKLNRLKYSDVWTLKDRSPYTAEFGRTIDDVLLDNDDDSCPENATCSPQSFQAIKSIMHLYPLWSATFQMNIERFGNDTSNAQVASDDAEPICQTNAAVESHFKSVKRSRLGGRLRRRPYQFVAAELQYVNGKVNKTKMPKLTSKRRKDVAQKEEGWRPKKRPAKYADPARAAKLMKSFTRSKRRLPYHLMRIELVQDALKRTFPEFDGLEAPGLRQCVRGRSLPRFTAAWWKFVQVLSVTNIHWVCATNAFTVQPNDVFLYNSLPGAISPDTILQVNVTNAIWQDITVSCCWLKQYSFHSSQWTLSAMQSNNVIAYVFWSIFASYCTLLLHLSAAKTCANNPFSRTIYHCQHGKS